MLLRRHGFRVPATLETARLKRQTKRSPGFKKKAELDAGWLLFLQSTRPTYSSFLYASMYDIVFSNDVDKKLHHKEHRFSTFDNTEQNIAC